MDRIERILALTKKLSDAEIDQDKLMMEVFSGALQKEYMSVETSDEATVLCNKFAEKMFPEYTTEITVYSDMVALRVNLAAKECRGICDELSKI